ncbi:AAA family ATPase [Streptomyces sp. TRM66268-LWL]|uniref:AAA family ATPase n=1 Tax=Streptomyces polyasparticus TaxID=2767826 RepID=A0ABR7SAC8_9ACTN|nr:LuxR family transcriptional regulator [Streptomyces polyasparticus]MBC9712099.1 AAA family ATPase [Streptomyces polyasparticus]
MGFVGRRAALATLARARRLAGSGLPQHVLVQGPAGIGKTALVREFLTTVDRALHADGDEAEAQLAYALVERLLDGRRTRWPDPPAAGAALLAALDEAQGDLSGEQVVALVVDDAQWADRSSLQALTFAVRRLRADRVLTLLVVRDVNDARLPDGLRRLFTADTATHVELDGLDAVELRQLSGGALTARAASRLRTHTGGNPLHTLALLDQEGPELLLALERSETAPPAPKSYTALVLTRLGACSPGTQALVGAAAVLGTSCALDEAAALAGGIGPRPGVAEAAESLEEALRAGLLSERPGDPLIRFPHPLVHAAVYHHLGPSRRTALHLRAAAHTADPAVALRHRAAAATGPDPVLAADLAALGRRFAADGAWANAAARLGAAARLVKEREAYERYTLEAVECRILAGEVPDVGEAARELGTFAASGWRSYLLGRLSLFDIDRAELLLKDAWRRCDPKAEPVLAARIAGQFAALYGSMARGAEMAEWAELALHTAPDDTATDMIRYLALIGRAMSGDAAGALAGLPGLPDPALASPAELEELLARGALREMTGDLRGALADLTGVYAHCPGRAASFRVLAATALASTEYRAGRWDDALVHCDFALTLAADTDQPHIALYCRTIATLLHSARGSFAKAAAHARVVREYASFGHLNPVVWAALAEAHLARAQGRHEEVAFALDPLLALGDRGDFAEPGSMPWADVLADAWTALDDHKRAASALASCETAAVQRGHHGALLLAARARGVLEAGRGDQSAAERAFRLALKHAEHVEIPFDRALLHLAYGQFLRRAGQRKRAGEQLARARELLVRLDARPDLERCERELAACGLQPGRRRTRESARLTPQELAVARQVAGGLTNRQVARELVISVKTVEYHLGRIFNKLNVDSRTQLAAVLAAEDQGDPGDNPGAFPGAGDSPAP